MRIENYIQEITESLHTVFAEVDTWFNQSEEVQNYCPHNQGWTIREILEHISLTSHFLLKLIDKGAEKALKNVNQPDLTTALEQYAFDRQKLTEIGIHRSFPWVRPAHMEPTGKMPLEQVRNTIQEQKDRCLAHLDRMPNGEGILYKTTMTVNDLGKIDVYQYIDFLAKHAQRHLTQMEKNRAEFKNIIHSK
jgi:hypothetical protein